ncbi:phenylacetate-CoA ligase [Methanolinea mesophila]|uniref:phenylacetate--CoA ligase family protein n=1 Tax=Methanolinea mesophila TaxID=547055 RepID=UPI001AE61ADC|nr:phenylacetate--CoA ligase family protein [Methanolinea mesophila]MBP1928342.1 phenylacetate-CoA ligase [Methanolinea mesophila]
MFSHNLIDKSFSSEYYRLQKNQWEPRGELIRQQEKNLRAIIKYSYENVPYYSKLFKKLDLKVNDISRIEDLNKIPILTKDIIKKNWEDFKPVNLERLKYSERSTGGSTGTPFRYRLSNNDRYLSGALLYRGWSYAGYQPGDKMVFFGGSSINGQDTTSLKSKVLEGVRNIKKFSAFDMKENDLKNYHTKIRKFRPKYIYGYPSALFEFANWLEIHDLPVRNDLISIFTTSEKIYPHMRNKIEEVFDCKICDCYGLNDGGVSAFECTEHTGLHLDTERSIIELADDCESSIENGEGRIITTSLKNFAMPFIRYDTGDLGSVTDEECNCGRQYRSLKELIGRSVDILIAPDGKKVHGWFFLYIFWEVFKGIQEYQVVQNSVNTITINIVPEQEFKDNNLEIIRSIIEGKCPYWDVEFNIVDNIPKSGSGKYKFIINKVNGGNEN